jgi:hypothetical protein
MKGSSIKNALRIVCRKIGSSWLKKKYDVHVTQSTKRRGYPINDTSIDSP